MGDVILFRSEKSQSPGGASPRASANILDILQAIKSIAPKAPDIDVWWLGSRSRLRVRADQQESQVIDFVVEGRPLTAEALNELSVSLSRLLGGIQVSVRLARSPADTRSFFRLLTRRSNS